MIDKDTINSNDDNVRYQKGNKSKLSDLDNVINIIQKLEKIKFDYLKY